MNNDEIKGRSGVGLRKLNSVRPFYMFFLRLAGIGGVTTYPDVKQGFSSLSMNTRKGPWRVNLLK